MKDKDIEKQIKKSVKNINVRDYSLVWDDIKDQIKPKQQYIKRKNFVRWTAVIASFVFLIIGSSIALPIIINQRNNQEPNQGYEEEPVYFMEQMGAASVGETEFYEALRNEKISPIDFSGYVRSNYCLLQTENNITKGGAIELSDDINEPTFLLSIRFYDDRVKGFEMDIPKFDLRYQVNETKIYYRVIEAYPEDSWYVYEVRANYNSVNYCIEYTCFTEDIKPFLNEFFK